MTSSLIGMIAGGAKIIVSLIMWAAGLFLVIKIALLGIGIMSSASSGSDAIKKIKDQGAALVVGAVVVFLTFTIRAFITEFISIAPDKGGNNTIVVGNDYSNWDSL